MEITKKPKSVVLIKGSLLAEDFDAYIKQVTEKFVADAELPGFRKGKAPEKMVVEKIGESALLEEAAEEALGKTYLAILKKHAIDAIGRPAIRITKLARGNALEFEAETAVLPEITLPDYKEIAKMKNAAPKEEIAVSDEELRQTMDLLRKSRSPSHTTSEESPELTDEFAQSVGKFKTVDELKNAIRENIKFEKEEKARDKRRGELVDAVREKSILEPPDVLILAEKEKMLTELRRGVESMGMEWSVYISHIKKTEDDLKNEWQKDAQRRVQSALVLREIAAKEHIKPSEDECNAWAYHYLMRLNENEKKDVDLARVSEYAYGVIRNQKAFEFLEQC